MTACIALCLISLFCVSAFAAAINKQGAISIALTDAGLKQSQVRMLEAEKENRSFEIEFINKKTGDKYSYEILTKNGLVKEAEIEYAHSKNFSNKKVGKTTAVKAAAKAAGVKAAVVKKGSVNLKKGDGELVYKIKFRNGKYRYECEVLAPTGRVTEYSKEYIGR